MVKDVVIVVIVIVIGQVPHVAPDGPARECSYNAEYWIYPIPFGHTMNYEPKSESP